MSPGAAIGAALAAALRARPEFAEVAVFDAPPVRAAPPYAVVGEAELSDWSTKSWTGRKGAVAVTLHDAGERPARLRALAGAVAEAGEALGGEIGGGWRAVTLRLSRERIARSEGRWRAVSEFAVRIYRADS